MGTEAPMRLLLPAARTIAVTLLDAIPMVHVDAHHAVPPGLGVMKPHEAHDYDLVADLAQPSRGPFSTHEPDPARAGMT